MAGFIDKIKVILNEFHENAGGIEAIFMVDLSDARVQASYPENNPLDLIGEATANGLGQFENQIKNLGGDFLIQEMELLSEKQRVLNFKISDNYILCLVCPLNGAKSGILRTMFNNKVKKDITTAMKEFGVS